jgi:hypothetical protein
MRGTLSVAFVVGILVVSGVVAFSSGTFNGVVTSKPTSSNTGLLSVVNPATGLLFTTSLNASTVPFGQTLDVSVNLVNSLGRTNNVTGAEEWKVSNASEDGGIVGWNCAQDDVFRVEVVAGNYGPGNFSMGAPLDAMKWTPPYGFNQCNFFVRPANGSAPVLYDSGNGQNYYVFRPDSNAAWWVTSDELHAQCLPSNGTYHPCSPPGQAAVMNETLVLETPKFASGPGVFTVITGDMWGDVDVGHFTVSPWNGAPSVYPGTSVYSSNGLRLTLSTNSTELVVGQGLNVTLSIDNTLGSVNSVKPSNDWLMHGVPVGLWPPCYFGLPAEAAVLQGNFSTRDISSAANITFSYICMEGVNVDHVVFQPNSDQVNLTGLYDVTSTNQTLGPFHMSLSFTTGGYWNLQNLSQQLNIPILGEQYPPRPPASVPFSPGVYTIAVGDEWGQVALIHVTVVPNSEAVTVNGLTCPVPSGYSSNVTVTSLLPRVVSDSRFLNLTHGQPFVFGNAEMVSNRIEQVGNQPPVHLPNALEMVFYSQGSATSCSMYLSDATSTIVVDVPIINGSYNLANATFNLSP